MKVRQLVMFVVLFCSFSAFSQRTISVASINWEPYTGENLPSYGFHGEITVEAFKRVGYTVEISFHPWARALDMAMNGEVDCLLTVYHTAEREESLYFSEPVTYANVVLWKNVGSNVPDSINSLQDLKDFRIVYLRGGAITPEFDAADYLKKVPSTTQAQAIQMLAAGRADLYASGLENVNFLMNHTFPEFAGKFTPIDPPLRTRRVFNVFPKSVSDSSKIVEDFNRGLQMLKDDGTLDSILKKHGQ